MPVNKAIVRLSFLCDKIPSLLAKLGEDELTYKSDPTKWSKKEILGHMIDSATNNHQRFIRIQYEHEPVIFYDQNKWVELTHYQNLPSSHLIEFWTIYNQHLLQVIQVITEENLELKGSGKDGQTFTLQFYIEDYVEHLEHHLKQLVNY